MEDDLCRKMMTSHLDSHTTTDVKPDMLSGVQTRNGIPQRKLCLLRLGSKVFRKFFYLTSVDNVCFKKEICIIRYFVFRHFGFEIFMKSFLQSRGGGGIL